MPPAHITVSDLATTILERRRCLDAGRSLLVGISGIDGAGKGWVTQRLADRLRSSGLRIASVGIDHWLALPGVRFNPTNPGAHFYHRALRQEAFVREFLRPLQQTRSVDVIVDVVAETASASERQRFTWTDVDIVLAEGIFLFKLAYRPMFDLAVWVACTNETALERAIARSQEQLPPEATVRAYRTIYFPAQRLHQQVDRPELAADFTIINDPRLASTV